MEYRIETAKTKSSAEKLMNEYVANGWKLHTFATSYQSSLFVMVFEK